jgi:hypothetical protein
MKMVEAAGVELETGVFTTPLKTKDITHLQRLAPLFTPPSRCSKMQQIPFRVIEKDRKNPSLDTEISANLPTVTPARNADF